MPKIKRKKVKLFEAALERYPLGGYVVTGYTADGSRILDSIFFCDRNIFGAERTNYIPQSFAEHSLKKWDVPWKAPEAHYLNPFRRKR